MLQGKAGEYTRIDKDKDDRGGRGSVTKHYHVPNRDSKEGG